MSTVVLGASTGLGRALAREWARAGGVVWLLARSREDIEREAASLALVHGVDVRALAVDAADAQALEAAMRDVILKDGPVRTLLCPIGASRDDDDTLLGAERAGDIVHVNLLATIVASSACLPGMLESGRGDIVGFGSIAAYRGRSRNAVYAAAKRGLESYFESLRHKAVGTGVRAHLFRLGYVDSQQSYGMSLPIKPVAPEVLAAKVRKMIRKGEGVRTVPARFAIIGAILRAMPWRIYKRMKF